MTALELCQSVLSDMAKAIADDQAAKGIRASGDSAASLKVEMTDEGGSILGSDYFYFQIHGRKPGKFPNIESILDWIIDRAIVPEDISINSLVFLIARKIATFGTKIFQGKAPGIDIATVVKTGSERMSKELTSNTVKEIMEAFKILKQ